MPAPFRIANHSLIEVPVALAPAVNNEPLNAYLEKLTKLIPGEVIGLYLVGSGLIPAADRGYLLGWTVFCTLAVVVSRSLGTRSVEQQKPVQWGAVVVSTISFAIWVYSMGGPFSAYLGAGYKPFLGSLLVIGWTFSVPFFYSPSD